MTGELSYRVLNTQGRLVISGDATFDKGGVFKVDLNDQPVGPAAMAFSTDSGLVMGLPLPVPNDCCEDWIHTEMGPRGRWIVRLIRFYRAEASQPWKSRELYVVDRDDDPISLATAYGRAWLFSHSTWPATQRPPTKRMTLAT